MKTPISIIISIISFFTPVISQSNIQEEDLPKPVIALLGTFHFAGSSDLMSLKIDDLSTEKRQEEIKILVKALEKFQPTKIILEYPFGNDKLDSIFQAYKKGQHTLSINERQQIGFRLAGNLEHDHVYPADHRMDLPFDEMMVYLQDHNQMDLFQALINDMQTTVMNVWQKAYETLTIKEFFVLINNEVYDNMNRNVYLQHINAMGDKDNMIGTEVVSKWWERNFRIMRNIDDVLEDGDRVLVIFGQGHTAILKDFYKSRTDVQYEDILKYLKV